MRKAPRSGWRFFRKVWIVALGAGLFWGGAVRGEVLGEGWAWRRALAFRQAVADAPGENVAWGEFYGNGTQKGAWEDLRITTAERVIVSHKLMGGDGVGEGKGHDQVRVAFATRGEGPYYAWWGNPAAGKAAEELEIQRGIYLEVLKTDGRPAAQLFGRVGAGGGGAARAGRNARAGGAAGGAGGADGDALLGAFFVPEMSMGFNPLGDERNVLLQYAGQFRIEKAVRPQMAFTTTDSGVLLVDGKEVVQERGGLRGQVRSPVGVDLAAGWHRMAVKQVSQRAGNTAMAVVWQRPGEASYTTVPAGIFAPVARATAGVLEKVGGSGQVLADFTVEPTAEAFMPPAHYAQRYTFEAQYPASARPQISWDFGDGQVSRGSKKVSHVFLSAGIYPVKLTLELGGSRGGRAGAGGIPVTTTLRVEVQERMYAKFPRPPEDPPRALQAMLKEYVPKQLNAEQALRGLRFFEGVQDAEGMIAWGRAWLEMGEVGTPAGGGGDELLAEETFALARALEGRKDFAGAAEMYRLASAKPVRTETRLKMLWLAVATACDKVGGGEGASKALSEAQGWVSRVERAGVEGKLSQGAVAYAAIALGDGKTARAAVESAERAGREGGGGSGDARFNQAQIRQGVLARNVENYIRTKELDAAWKLINEWEMEFPRAAWEGFTRTLRVKLMAAEGWTEQAARMALAHAQANTEGFYAAELLYRAAELFDAAGKGEEAGRVMEMLRTRYPESPYARGGGGRSGG